MKCKCGKIIDPKYKTCFACSDMDKCACGKYKKKEYATCFACKPVKPVKDKPSWGCEECGKPLVAIGNSRKGGVQHEDWEGRTMHKKCWLLKHEELKWKCWEV